MATPRAARASRQPASPLIALYAVVQCVLSGYVFQDGTSNRDAHAIARGILHFLSCLVLLLGACTLRVDDGVLLALAGSLAILVDGGVRALAAATALTTTTKRYPPQLSQSTVYVQVATSLAGTLLFHVLPRYLNRRRRTSRGGNNKTSQLQLQSQSPCVISPLYVCARAHALSTLLVRLNAFLPDSLLYFYFTGDFSQLVYACCTVVAAAHSAQFASRILLRPDPAVVAAQRILYETVPINNNNNGEFAAVWRDETGTIRAVVTVRSREYRDASYASNTKARIRTALAGLVDDLYLQVEAVAPLTRSISTSQVVC